MAGVEAFTGLKYSDHQDLRTEYLRQLRRFIRLKKDHEPELNSDGHQLMNRMISRRNVDSRKAGVGDQANNILKESFPELYSRTPEPAHPQAPTFTEAVSDYRL